MERIVFVQVEFDFSLSHLKHFTEGSLEIRVQCGERFHYVYSTK